MIAVLTSQLIAYASSLTLFWFYTEFIKMSVAWKVFFIVVRGHGIIVKNEFYAIEIVVQFPLEKFITFNLVDSASSHTLVSKIKPCMSKCKYFTLKLRMAHYISYSLFDSPLLLGYP